MKKTIIMAILGSSLGANAQTTNTGIMEINAVIDAGCFLTANNINFGILQMPLSNQNASSEMIIHCSSNSPYSIKIGYGNSIATGMFSYVKTSNGTSQGHPYENIKLYKDGNPISKKSSDIQCFRLFPEKTAFLSNEAATLYGYHKAELHTFTSASSGVCNNSGVFLSSSLTSLGGTSLGELTGVSNGEKIAFEILNPSNQNWASNSYSDNGNGLEQKIILKAQIKKENSPTHRLSADTYQSNVTVQLTY